MERQGGLPQRPLHQRRLARRSAVGAISETLSLHEQIGQVVFLLPLAGVDEQVDVRAVGPVGVGEHAQRGGGQITSRLLHRLERVLANEVLRGVFISLRTDQRGLGQQLHLQRQQVAEDARQRDHHVDTRTPE